MNLNNQKIIVNIDDKEYIDWKMCLKSKLKNLKSYNVEIDSKNLHLSCKDILEIIAFTSQFNCKVFGFFSTSS